ncbi:response regulator [Methanofollis fontis]|uniref:Response regulator n=1 Tax=Methanofollis fontis TaxID=2052832 RepID=A0A483CUC8_9EURY|nr:response regulator [Methanofollis fontis]TAJ45196.1 response regulator [Methanofollis fontis]
MTRILIIDDSSFQRKIISTILSGDGHETIFAPDGTEGLRLLVDAAPDLLVLDLLMPGVDGLEVLRLMRQDSICTPVIVLTADIQDSTREQCSALGARAFINKPVKRDELLSAVREVLAEGKEQ